MFTTAVSYCPRSGCEICGLRTWVEILPGSGCAAPLSMALCALSRSVRRVAAPKCPASAVKIPTAMPMPHDRHRIPVRRLPVRRLRDSRLWKVSRCRRRSRPIRRPTVPKPTARNPTVPSSPMAPSPMAPNPTAPNPTVPSPTVPSPTVLNTPPCSTTSPSTAPRILRRQYPQQPMYRRRLRCRPRHPWQPTRRRLPFLNTGKPRAAAMRRRRLGIPRRPVGGPGSLTPPRRAARRRLHLLTLPRSPMPGRLPLHRRFRPHPPRPPCPRHLPQQARARRCCQHRRSILWRTAIPSDGSRTATRSAPGRSPSPTALCPKAR
jgi:hypothetical protein